MCHHDGVGHIETEVGTHENLQTTVCIIYKDIMMSIETEIQNITVLVMLALSVRTAVLERNASVINNIKNHLRTTLQQNSHNHLMQIKVNGHSLDETTFILGDFNAHHLSCYSRLTDTRGRRMANSINRSDNGILNWDTPQKFCKRITKFAKCLSSIRFHHQLMVLEDTVNA